MAGAFGGLLLLARLVKGGDWEDATGRARHLAATTPNVFLWSALISPPFAHDPSSVSGMLVMWAVLLFFGRLVLREQRLVRGVREHIALPVGSIPWSAVTAKIAALPKVTASSPGRHQSRARIEAKDAVSLAERSRWHQRDQEGPQWIAQPQVGFHGNRQLKWPPQRPLTATRQAARREPPTDGSMRPTSRQFINLMGIG
jgi:hypothetical protein